MKYDLPSGESKDTYRNITVRSCLRLGHSYTTSSNSTRSGLQIPKSVMKVSGQTTNQSVFIIL